MRLSLDGEVRTYLIVLNFLCPKQKLIRLLQPSPCDLMFMSVSKPSERHPRRVRSWLFYSLYLCVTAERSTTCDAATVSECVFLCWIQAQAAFTAH